MVITKKQWQEAQIAEREQHTYSYEQGVLHYRESYKTYAEYIGLSKVNGTVIEIGSGDFPALQHYPASIGIVIEPMPSKILEYIAEHHGLIVINKPVEELDLPPCEEIWILNVMQHIINPDLFVAKCKASAKVIRYFEPIDYPTCLYHPHTYTLQQFKKWFGDAKRYEDKIPGFHQADCAYGVWKKN